MTAIDAIVQDMRREVCQLHEAAFSPDISAREAGMVNAAAAKIQRYADRLSELDAALGRSPARPDCVCTVDDGLVQEWVSKARAVAKSKGYQVAARLRGGTSKPRFVCPEHGATFVDEDGCCRTCGADTEVMQAALPSASGASAAESEQCICAAIRLPNGEVWRGHRHDDAIHTAFKANVAKADIHNAEQGFITSRNRFVGREEGAVIQQRAGIVSADTGSLPSGMLFSEDLYLRNWRQAAPASPAGSAEKLPKRHCAACGFTITYFRATADVVCPRCRQAWSSPAGSADPGKETGR